MFDIKHGATAGQAPGCLSAALDLNQRARLTRETMAAWRDQPFVWNTSDCKSLSADHLARFGHDPNLAQFRAYDSETGACRALRKAGYLDTTGWIDSLGLERIAPARALTGDLMGFTMAGEVMTGLCVVIGPQLVLGFHRQTRTAIAHAVRFDLPGVTSFAWRT